MRLSFSFHLPIYVLISILVLFVVGIYIMVRK
ncbi:hypothetical protein ALO84_200116 [Pseudomonas syringae pv. maculicola]|nr:hypothetical protein ALO84_200116 [Pseudomonas syringae pv. maculicola]